METTFVSHSVEETQELAARLAQGLQAGDVLLLSGDLGAGKTHFTQGLARGLDIAQVPTSPTFNIMYVYDGGRLPLYHFDLYRLDDESELDDIDYFATLEGDGVCAVEWADKFPDAQPDERLDIVFRVDSDGLRSLTCTAEGLHYEELLAALSA